MLESQCSNRPLSWSWLECSHLTLTEPTLGLEVLIELSTGAGSESEKRAVSDEQRNCDCTNTKASPVFENQVNPLVVEEVTIEAEDVHVAEVGLNLNLSAELVLRRAKQ